MVNYQTAAEPIQINDKFPNYDLLRFIFENAQDIIAISSPEGRVEYISPSVNSLLGYEQEEVLGTLSQEFFYYEDLLKIANSCLLQNSDENIFECRVRHKDGHYIWFETTVKFLRNDNGKIVNLIGVGRKISDRKQAEEENLKTKEQLESFIENTADAIWVTNLEDIVLDVNPSFEKMFGWSAKEVEGEKLPFIPDKLKETMDHLHQRIKLGETVVGFETTRQKKDGQLLDVEATLSPIRDRSGSIIGMTGICRDVSAKKQAEEELKAKTSLLESFIENNVDAIVIYNQEGILQRVNKTFEKVFGWTKEEILGMELGNVPYIPAKFANEANQLFEQVKMGQSMIGLETIRKNKDGVSLNVSLSASPIIDEKGCMNGWSVTLRDITEWKKTQLHLQNSEKLSVAGQLAAGIAHEIRNPMTAIKGFIQLFQSELKDKQKYFEIISSEIDRIELILSELLILAKPQSVKYDKKDIRVLISQVITLLESQAIMKNIQFVTEFQLGAAHIFCDENQLKQVFINFIQNSMESMQNGGTITIEVNSENDQEMLIRLTDQGCGISKEVLSKLGEPFYTTKEKGTGLGFMVSKKIIENHAGKIMVESELNKGTTIEIRLPISYS
jgi:PAS domain S-box-containing protein